MTDEAGEGMADATPTPSDFDAFSAVFDKHRDVIEDSAAADGFDDDAPGQAEASDGGEDSAGPERDERGRFKARDDAGDADESAADTEEAPEAAAESAPEIAPPPAHLLGPIKEAWNDLPEGVRDAVVRQQQEVDRKFGEIGQSVRVMKPVYERVDAIFKEFPEFQRLPQDQRIEGLRYLASVQSMMEKDAIGTWLKVADQYGLTPHLKERLTGEAPSDASQNVAALNREITDLRRQLSDAMNPERVNELVSRQFAERDVLQSVQEFASSKDLFPMVQEKLPDFIQLVQSVRPDLTSPTAVLDAAYEMAVHAIPAAREKMQEATAKAAAPAPDPKRVESARKAAAVNLRGRDAAKPRPKSDKEAFEEVWNKHGLG